MFQGIDNVDTPMDDVIIHGESFAEHDKALLEVMKRVKQNNLNLTKKSVSSVYMN